MSDTVNGLQKAAESALLQVIARWLVIAICMTALPIGGWLGTRLVGTLDALDSKVDKLALHMAVVETDISYLKERVKP